MTGFNPMGESRPAAENRAANEALAEDLARLGTEEADAMPLASWAAFGQGAHLHTMRWMTWRAPVHYMVDDVASTGT